MPARPLPHPTEAELELLQVLWDRGPSTVREVHEIVNGPRNVAYTTTLKILQIMFEKGLVKRDDSERSHLYTAAVQREKTQQSILRTLVDRVFGGSAHDMVLAALGTAKVSPDELAKIKEALASAKPPKKK